MSLWVQAHAAPAGFKFIVPLLFSRQCRKVRVFFFISEGENFQRFLDEEDGRAIPAKLIYGPVFFYGHEVWNNSRHPQKCLL